MIQFLQSKPVHIRKRIAVIGTGIIAVILVMTMVYVYSRPQVAEKGPEEAIVGVYATLLAKVQSLFTSK